MNCMLEVDRLLLKSSGSNTSLFSVSLSVFNEWGTMPVVKEVLIIKVFRGAMDGKHTLVSLWNMIQLTDEGIALNYEIRDVTFLLGD